jgi:uncharacterized membrane-anchored protein YhcB (DUF1043 family)
MQTWVLFAIGIAVIVVLGIGMVVFVLLRNVRTAQGQTMHGKYPQGHWMSIGMCIGVAIGSIPALVGLFLDDMSSWAGIAPAMGLGLGIAIGSVLERKHKDELRPLTEEEQRLRFRMTLVALGVLALLVLSLFVLGGIALFAPR